MPSKVPSDDVMYLFVLFVFVSFHLRMMMIVPVPERKRKKRCASEILERESHHFTVLTDLRMKEEEKV